jgi:hypothetical protein
MNTVQILIAARALIANSENWTKRFMARDKDGKPVRSTVPEAVCWCALGALRRICGSTFGEPAEILNEEMGFSITAFNDLHTHAEVLAAFDRAIAAADLLARASALEGRQNESQS